MLCETSRSVGFTEGTDGFWAVKMSTGHKTKAVYKDVAKLRAARAYKRFLSHWLFVYCRLLPFFRMVLLETSARLGRPWILSQSVAGDYLIYAVFTFLLSCHSAVRVSNTYWISSRAFPASSVRSSSLSSWWPSLKNQWLAGRERKWVMCEEPFLLD